MSRWARLAVVALAAVVILPAILYISDALILKYRLGRGTGRDTVTVRPCWYVRRSGGVKVI